MWIYKVTNIHSGKVYIGQTIRPVEVRWKRHVNDAMNNVIDTHFARAIRKHGEDSFIVEIIDTAKTQEELTQKEREWILYYNSIDNRYGYNETAAEYKCGGNTYLSKSDDEMKVIRDKIRNSKLGGKNPNASAIKMINTVTGEEMVFMSQKECQTFLGLSGHHAISRRCRGKINSPLNGIYQFEFYNN